MSFLSALGGGGGGAAAGGATGATAGAAGTAATAGQAAGAAGALSGFEKFMTLIDFAANPQMQQGFAVSKLLGSQPSTGDLFGDITQYMMQDKAGEEATLLGFFNALNKQKKPSEEEQNARLWP